MSYIGKDLRRAAKMDRSCWTSELLIAAADRIAELEARAVTDEQLVINRAHKLILAADRHLSECGGLIPAMLKEYYESRAALQEDKQ